MYVRVVYPDLCQVEKNPSAKCPTVQREYWVLYYEWMKLIIWETEIYSAFETFSFHQTVGVIEVPLVLYLMYIANTETNKYASFKFGLINI